MLLALALVGFGAFELVSALSQDWHEGGNAILTAIGYVVIALAVFDVAKYFVEEEVLRNRSLVTTSDVRRSLTKFISTIAIAFHRRMVIVFQVSKHDVDKMPYPTALLATAILMFSVRSLPAIDVEVSVRSIVKTTPNNSRPSSTRPPTIAYGRWAAVFA